MTVAEERPQIEQAVTEFYAYTEQLMQARRETPGEDLISELLDRADDVELLNLVLNVLVGGVDTTQSQLAHGLRLFAEHPDQWEHARATNPSLAPNAVDEIVRFEPITPFTARIAMEDVTYRDVTFPQDTIVLVCAQTGNRDPDTYEDPDTFDITRDQNARAHVRRRPALLPGREPGQGRDAGGAGLPRAADARPRARRRAGLRHDRRHLRPRRAAAPWTATAS